MDMQFQIGTETYAEKARRLLDRYRYRYQMRKTVGKNGCAYRFSVSAPEDEIAPLLRSHGIPYQMQ